MSIPLSPVESLSKTHAILCGTGFLVLLPMGALIARYGRNFTRHWFWTHTIFQSLFAGPVIFAGYAEGHNIHGQLGEKSDRGGDAHRTIGQALVILYVVQLVIGLFIHYVKFPSLFGDHRPPQNYIHVLLGIAILALSAYNMYNGLYIEWLLLGGVHKMTIAAKHAWLALVVVFWALYFLGLAFLPRQFKQEKASRGMRVLELEKLESRNASTSTE